MSKPGLPLAMIVYDMKWAEMTEFAEFIGAIATDDDGKPNDPDYIARCLHSWARSALFEEPTR